MFKLMDKENILNFTVKISLYLDLCKVILKLASRSIQSSCTPHRPHYVVCVSSRGSDKSSVNLYFVGIGRVIFTELRSHPVGQTQQEVNTQSVYLPTQ